MNVFSYLSDIVQVEIEAMSGAGLLPRGLDLSAVSVEPPREAEHGDAACNAALVLAKQARRKPREIAQNLAERLQGRADIRAVEVAGPGFVNLRLTDEFWWARLAELLQTGPGYGATDLGRGRRSMSSTSRPTRRGRSTSGTPGARWWAMPSPTCSRIWVSR